MLSDFFFFFVHRKTMCRNYCYKSFIMSFCLIFLLCFVSMSSCQNWGPLVKMTSGQVWPKPVNQLNYNEYLQFEPENFRFKVTGHSCDNLQEAFKRYNSMLFLRAKKNGKHSQSPSRFVVGTLKELIVQMNESCAENPTIDMDEKYEININKTGSNLVASSIWGILRGLETFSQLVTLKSDGSLFVIRCTSIVDYPKFKHRGYLLDTSRHYFPVKKILDTLDAMSYSKLNVFHWHIVDDNSFPFQSSSFPKLSEKGAYGKSAIYTRNNVKLVIEYAKLRGIRVIPEFDTPGHTLSWGPGGIPGLLTPCMDSVPNHFGPIDPTIEDNYNFIRTLFTEVKDLFQDQYFHLGGDEVEYSIMCWSTNTKVQDFMWRNNIKNVTELEDYYFRNIFNITRNLKAIPIVWEELFNENINLDPNTVVQVWKSDYNSTISKVMECGHPVLLSSCWYLNYITYGSEWLNFYRCDPSEYLIDKNRDLFLGGEACMWGEFVDETNVLQYSWPAGSAVAEVLWSQVLNETEAQHRLEEHVCRMRRRGIPAAPASGPNYCPY